jgi:nucleotide-binding universal stress UspA family protein
MKTLADNQNRNRAYVVPDHILLATDLDDIEYLLPHAIAQAQASGATLTLVHVTPHAESIPLDASAIYSVDAAAILVEAKWALEGMAAKAYASRVTSNPIVCQGSPQRIVPELVKTIGADRLILGTHGRRHVKKILLGSVAQEILANVDVPVFTIGPNAHTRPVLGRPKRILHPVSFRPGFEVSACFALVMAQFYQAEITLLHVVDREHKEEHAEEWTRAQLQRLVPDEALLWTYVNAQVEVGGVVDHILNVAIEMRADAIVLGVDAGGSLWPGNRTAYAIIAQAGCPVFTIRHHAQVDPANAESKSESTHTDGMFAGTF